MDCSMPGFPVHHQLPKLAQIYVHQVGDANQSFHPNRPLLLLPSILSSIRVFSDESGLRTRWLKYWSFSFGISPSNEYSGLISFRMDWLGLLAVQGTLKSLLQYHGSKASALQHSAFFIVQLSHPYTLVCWQLNSKKEIGNIPLDPIMPKVLQSHRLVLEGRPSERYPKCQIWPTSDWSHF